MRKLIVCGVGLVAALALTVPGAFGGAAQTPGVTAKTITIGGTFPLTGRAAAYAPIPLGMKAYFSYINARRGPDGKRGVMGRQIIWKYYDDGYNPANTVQLTRRLVEQDKVFATVGQLGTEPVLAARPYMNQQKVPQALVSTGRRTGGRSTRSSRGRPAGSPTTSPRGGSTGCTSRRTTAARRSRSSTRTTTTARTGSTVSVRRSGSSTPTPTSSPQEPVEVTATSVASQMARIRASGAQVFVIFATPDADDPRVSRPARRSATTPSRST